MHFTSMEFESPITGCWKKWPGWESLLFAFVRELTRCRVAAGLTVFVAAQHAVAAERT